MKRKRSGTVRGISRTNPNVESEEEKRPGHTGPVYSVAFSPNGKRVASGSADDTVRIWDVETGEQKQELKGHTQSVNSVAFSRDGTRVVSGSSDGTARIWDVETGKLQQELKASRGDVKDTYHIWDRAGQHLGTFKGASHRVNSVAFSPSGALVASGSEDGAARIWKFDEESEEWKCIHELKVRRGGVSSVSFSPKGKFLMCGARNSVYIWDVETGELNPKGPFILTNTIKAISFFPDGKRVVSGTVDDILIWDAETGRWIGYPRQYSIVDDYFRIFSTAFSRDGTRVVTGSSDNTVRIWDAETGQQQQELKGHSEPVYSVSFSRDGTRVVSGSSDNTVRIWEGDRLSLMKNTLVALNIRQIEVIEDIVAYDGEDYIEALTIG